MQRTCPVLFQIIYKSMSFYHRESFYRRNKKLAMHSNDHLLLLLVGFQTSAFVVVTHQVASVFFWWIFSSSNGSSFLHLHKTWQEERTKKEALLRMCRRMSAWAFFTKLPSSCRRYNTIPKHPPHPNHQQQHQHQSIKSKIGKEIRQAHCTQHLDISTITWSRSLAN